MWQFAQDKTDQYPRKHYAYNFKHTQIHFFTAKRKAAPHAATSCARKCAAHRIAMPYAVINIKIK
jgi:ribosomal protein S11